MKYNCKWCGKEFESGYGNNIFCSHSCSGKYATSKVSKEQKQSSAAKARTYITYKHTDNKWGCNICNAKFRSRSLMYAHKKEHTAEEKQKEYECPFCNKKWKVSKSGLSHHKKCCAKNPNRVDGNWKGRTHTEESKKKISEGAKKAHDEGRGHTWKNRYLFPSYAEQWLYDLLDNNHIEYEKEKPFFGFFLDVAVGNKCIEIDGGQHGEDTRFPEQVERDKRKDKLLAENGWKELRIKWSDVKKMPDYFAEKIIEFIKTGETIFDGEFASRKSKEETLRLKREELVKNKQIGKDGKLYSNMLTETEWLERKQKILESEVNLNELGCINKISKITGLSRGIIAKTLRKYNISWKTHNYK